MHRRIDARLARSKQVENNGILPGEVCIELALVPQVFVADAFEAAFYY
jgi:hypothetical protein